MSKPMLVALLTLGAVGAPVMAQNRAGRGPMQMPMLAGISEADKNKASEWLKDHMPNLWTLAFVESPRQRRFAPIAWNHYRNFEKAQTVPYNGIVVRYNLLTTYAAEDKIYGLILQLDKSPADSRIAIRDAIRSAVRGLIESNFNERANRIEKLKKDLANEEKRLAADRANIDQLITKRMNNQFVSENPPATVPATRPSIENGAGAGSNTLAAPVR